MKRVALVLLTCGTAIVILAVTNASKRISRAIWEAGFVDAIADKNRCDLLDSDIARADFEVEVMRDERLDIGIGQILNGSRTPITYALDDLKYFFQQQHRKGFIVVIYHKNAPDADLPTSIKRLKDYFQSLGYKRILLLHAHSSGWIVHEDYRPIIPR